MARAGVPVDRNKYYADGQPPHEYSVKEVSNPAMHLHCTIFDPTAFYRLYIRAAQN